MASSSCAADSQAVVDPTSGCQPEQPDVGQDLIQGWLVQTRNCNDTLQLLKDADEDRRTLRESLESCEDAFQNLQVFGKPHLKNTEADRPTKLTPITSIILTKLTFSALPTGCGVHFRWP